MTIESNLSTIVADRVGDEVPSAYQSYVDDVQATLSTALQILVRRMDDLGMTEEDAEELLVDVGLAERMPDPEPAWVDPVPAPQASASTETFEQRLTNLVAQHLGNDAAAYLRGEL